MENVQGFWPETIEFFFRIKNNCIEIQWTTNNNNDNDNFLNKYGKKRMQIHFLFLLLMIFGGWLVGCDLLAFGSWIKIKKKEFCLDNSLYSHGEMRVCLHPIHPFIQSSIHPHLTNIFKDFKYVVVCEFSDACRASFSFRFFFWFLDSWIVCVRVCVIGIYAKLAVPGFFLLNKWMM